ncbi:PLP-dependent cysteine synthase family protein [Haloparvum sp. PAK95]|uniref:PLP-dependent cysteine synthase family protein n=1 Tax=Haloparvum sp. PAK95 TaxID=3418962 RepID=UPI003D2F0D46
MVDSEGKRGDVDGDAGASASRAAAEPTAAEPTAAAVPPTNAAGSLDESTLFETPLVELDLGIEPTVYAKAEWFNFYTTGTPGTVKSRIGYAMIDAAQRRGDLDPDQPIIEPSSGNTGAAVARVGTARGYDVTIASPEDAGAGKREVIREAGAELTTVPAAAPYDAIIEAVERAAAENDYYWPNQYMNPDNPGIHEATTGAEIREQAPELTHYVTGAGTGGTITGVARALGDEVTIVGYEPASDPSEIEGTRYLRTGNHPYQDVYEQFRVDEKRYLTTDTAMKAARWLRLQYADREIPIRDTGQWDRDQVRAGLRVDGEFVVGPSTGANVALVYGLAHEGFLARDDVVVTTLCDRGDRYSEGLWSDLF